MSLTRILPSMIDSTAASDGDALVYSAANARFEFGAAASGGSSALGSIANNTLDLSTGNFFEVTADDQTLSFSNPPAAHAFTVKVTGAGTITGYDLSVASYDAVSFSVAGQTTDPSGLAFSTDGTKMYIIGFFSPINEYDLSTAWDVSTASYLQNFSVAAQESLGTGLFFKPDGLKMYVIGRGTNSVNEYDLSIAWDVSTASYLQNFSVAAQEDEVTDVFFKPDGLKMYVSGRGNDRVQEYDLSTVWDISTASFLQNISIRVDESSPAGVSFRPDGLKMYIIGTSGVDVNEYDLSTAWDVSTASYLQNFSVAAQDPGPEGLFFKPDGLKMYVIGSSGDSVYQYTTSSITTATIAFPASVTFESGSPPAAPAIGEVSTVELYTVDSGVTYYDYVTGGSTSVTTGKSIAMSMIFG